MYLVILSTPFSSPIATTSIEIDTATAIQIVCFKGLAVKEEKTLAISVVSRLSKVPTKDEMKYEIIQPAIHE